VTLHIGAATAAIESIRNHAAKTIGAHPWNTAGIRAALEHTEGAPGDVLAAAALAASDPGLKLPSANGFRAHWPKNATAEPRRRHTQRCAEHPDHDAPHDHGGDMTPEDIAAAVAAVKALIKPTVHARPLQEKP
jgi:hypothetical protein